MFDLIFVSCGCFCVVFSGSYDECVAYGVDHEYLEVEADGTIVADHRLSYEEDAFIEES